MAIIKSTILLIFQGVWILAMAPLLAGIINKMKARLQGRSGPRIFQPYYDLIKYFNKEAIFSKYTSWLTISVPYIVFTATLVSGLFLPMISSGFGINGDVIFFIYLLALARFVTALAALDTGSSFGGMGATREMGLNTVIEPAFMLAVLTIILQTGTTNFSHILAGLTESALYMSLPYVLALIAMLLVILGETSRVPIDNMDTHLELTMIHEGMVLEYSGRYLGLMSLSSMVKQFLFIGLFVLFFLPYGQIEVTGFISGLVGIVFLSVKILFVGVIIAFIEMMYAKIRLYQVPKLFMTSMTLSFLAIIIHLLS